MDARAPIFATLGCRLNAYETEAMRELSAAAGLDNAVIVNTCAVTAEAVRKAKQEIRRLRRELAEARRANEMAHSSGGGPATSSGSRSLPGSNASITAAVDRPVWVD